MDQISIIKSQLRQKKQEYQNLRNDYEIAMQNMRANVAAKKELRNEIATLQKEYSELQNDAGRTTIKESETINL
jgi:predicted nuclease with TOPRIM domain